MDRIDERLKYCASLFRSGQRTLICVSVTSSGRLLTMILLSPGVALLRDGATGAVGLVTLLFCTPPVGAAMAALALDLALRAGRGLRPPRAARPPAGLVSSMIWSRDWSSFPDMLILGEMLLVGECSAEV